MRKIKNITRPALTPAMQAGTGFTHPGVIEGWVDLRDRLCAEYD